MKKALVLLPLALAFSLPSAVFANPGDYCIYDSDCGSATEKCIEQECQFFSAGASNTGGGGAGGVNTGKLQSLAGTITSLVNSILVPLLTAIAFLVFLFGVFNYFILGGAEDEKRKTGRQFVLYGIIGFVLIFSLWGLVNVGVDVFNLGGQTHAPYPKL